MKKDKTDKFEGAGQKPRLNLRNLGAIVVLTTGLLINNLSYSQTSQNSRLSKTSSTELVIGDSIDHNQIINMNVDDILLKYGEEKGMEIIREHILIEINKVRQEFNDSVLDKDDFPRKIKPLSLSVKLTDAAQKYAQHLYENNRYDHVGKDGSTFESRIKATGYPFDFFGENLFHSTVSTPTIRNAIMARKASTGHHRTMNGKHYLNVGVGYCKGYWVTNFGGPRKL